jgi:predicted transcriptional regulator
MDRNKHDEDEVLKVIDENPGIHSKDLYRKLEKRIGRTRVNQAVERLEVRGVVMRDRNPWVQ